MSGGDASLDWAALYLRHRDAMYRVAATVLRASGRADEAPDVVQDAVESLMKSPPEDVRDWEAVMITAAKRKAIDYLRSAVVRHAGPELNEAHDAGDSADVAEDVAELVDRQRLAAVAWDKLSILDERHRKVVWEYVARERPRAEVAQELDVSPARVSQMATAGLAQLRDALNGEEVEE